MIDDLEPLCNVVKFVDDTTLYGTGSLQDYPSNLLQNELKSVHDWCSDNDIKLNARKTKEMTIDFGQSQPNLVPLVADGVQIE